MERGGQNELSHYIVWFGKVRPKKNNKKTNKQTNKAIHCSNTVTALLEYLDLSILKIFGGGQEPPLTPPVSTPSLNILING